MVRTEVIAVNDSQKRRLRAAAQSRVAYWRRRGKPVKLDTYYKTLPHKVARNFKTGCGRTPHSVVRVACGLRKQANINHRSKLRIKYRGHKRGIACYTKWGHEHEHDYWDVPQRDYQYNDCVKTCNPDPPPYTQPYDACLETCEDNKMKHHCKTWVKGYNNQTHEQQQRWLDDFPFECKHRRKELQHKSRG